MDLDHNQLLGTVIILSVLTFAALQVAGVGSIPITFASILLTAALALLGAHEGLRQSQRTRRESRDEE